MKPIIIINFKTYLDGEAVIKLAKKIQKVSKDIIIGVQAIDIFSVAKTTKLKVFAEHVDPYERGRHTGFIVPEAVKKDRAKGTFLNHSEHKIPFKTLIKTVKICRKHKLKVGIFASNLKEARKIKKLKPDYLIIEPPELVAGDISVSKAKPGLIKNIAKKLKTPFIVGAGIKTSEDVKIAMSLGASGIAISSAITKSKNPEKTLRKLLE
ncbi:MAG: triose-phosphate isomerase [Nanoarchaeota archaeon]